MKHILAAVALSAALAAPAFAALKTGVTAPDFTADGALAGQPFTFHLAEALKKGPVAVYFFPAAFTSGCTQETKMFADAADEFAANGATLVGVTRGNTDRLAEFSTETCRNKFPVAAVSEKTVKAYKVSMMLTPGWSDRTSYVIAQDGTIKLAYSALNPKNHVAKTLAAVKALKAN